MSRKEGFRADIYNKTYDLYYKEIEKDSRLCGQTFWNQINKQVEREVMMNINFYESYKNLYDLVKPIRGREVDVRPLGQRRRDWETIEKRGDNYACRLYQTDAVTYYPDNSVGLVAGVWATPLTAEFIHNHSPFYCYKKYKKLWIRVQTPDGDKHYPIPEEGELLMLRTGEIDGIPAYEPSEPIVIQQRVVDRDKAKQARESIKPFLEWAKMFMKLSDGWIMAETREQFCSKVETAHWRMQYHYNLPEGIVMHQYYGASFVPNELYKYLSECDSDGYMPALLLLLDSRSKSLDCRKVREVTHAWGEESSQTSTVQIYDLQFSYDYLKRQVYALVDKSNDTHKVVEVEIGDKAMTNIL
jgi:hypothetical protein